MENQQVVKDSSLVNKDISIDALVPNENNVNEMPQSKYDRLVKEMVEVGFLDPLAVIPLTDNKFFIMGGEHRWKAAKQIGLTYVPCVIHDPSKWSDMDQVEIQSIKLNVLKGDFNTEKFIRAYDRLCQKVGVDKIQEAMAITDSSEWKKLTRNITKTLKEGGASQELLDEVKDAERKARNPDELTKKLSKLLKDHAESLSAANFMMFQHKGGEHVLIQSDEVTFSALRRIQGYATQKQLDVNVLLRPVLVQLAADLEKSP